MLNALYLNKLQRYGHKYIEKQNEHDNVVLSNMQNFPDKYDMCKYIFHIFDQNHTNACTSCAVISAYMIQRAVKGYPEVLFSCRWLYFIERFREELILRYGELPVNWYERLWYEGYLVTGDKGADANDGIEIILCCGCPAETSWPHITSNKAQLNKIPPETLKIEAKKHMPIGGRHLYVDSVDETKDGSLLEPKLLEQAIKRKLLNNCPVLLAYFCFSSILKLTGEMPLDSNGVLQLPPLNWIVTGAHQAVLEKLIFLDSHREYINFSLEDKNGIKSYI